MKKFVMLTVLFCTMSLGMVYGAARWEKGVKVTGWYYRDGLAWNWKSGAATNIIRVTPFSTWANNVVMNYGESVDVNGNLTYLVNNGGISTNYVKNITAFTNWNFYIAMSGQLLNPSFKDESNYTEGWLTYGKTLSRYISVSGGVKGSKAGTESAQWLRASMSLTRPIGYRSKISWLFTYNNNLTQTSVNKVESSITYNYKLGKRFSINIVANTSKDSTATDVYRYETIELTYDLLNTGGTTF